MSVLTTLLAQTTTEVTIKGDDIVGLGRAIAFGLGVGLGAAGAGIGIGNIFGSMIEAVARQPELRGELTGIQCWASRSPRPLCSTAYSVACSPSCSPNQ